MKSSHTHKKKSNWDKQKIINSYFKNELASYLAQLMTRSSFLSANASLFATRYFLQKSTTSCRNNFFINY